MKPEKPDNENSKTLTTKQLDPSQFNPELREKLEGLGEVKKKSERELILHMPHRSDPFSYEVEGTLTIGRSDSEQQINPTIDLTPYFAAQLGVSRFHAEITYMNGRFYIKDMGSTNGTQINGNRIDPYRLVPFNTGDEIRLGHFPIIVG